MRPPPTGPVDRFGVARRFDACLDRQLELCLALEALADSLPSQLDTHAAMMLVNRLPSTLARCHRLEERMVFPVLRISNRDLSPILERLRTEHLEDEDQAEDVCEAVKTFVTHRSKAGAEEIGYMLRGLFTQMRRHVAFDREHVLPLFRRCCGS